MKWTVWLRGRDTPLYLCQVHKDELANMPTRPFFVEKVRLAPTQGVSGRPAMISGCRWTAGLA